MVLGGSELLVGLLVHELLEIGNALLGELDLGDPTAAGRVVLGDLVDRGGALLEGDVVGNDLAADGSVDVGSRLDGLDGAEGITGLDLLALLGELDEDDVAEGLGGVGADADVTGLLVVGELDPLVLAGVLPYFICSCGCGG